MPGRTDNEVKNFWNTKIKRRMKIEASILNSDGDGNNQKLIGNFDYHFQHRKNKLAHLDLHPDLSISIPNNSYTSQYSLSPFSTPISFPFPFPFPNSHSNLNSLSNPNFNIINTTSIGDPILSFLNNPTYKFKLILEDEAKRNDADNFNITFPLIPKTPMTPNPNDTVIANHTHLNNSLNAPNNMFFENRDHDIMFTTNSLQHPLQQMTHNEHSLATPPSSVITCTSNRLNNIYTSWSVGNNSEEENSSIIDQGKSSTDMDRNGMDKEIEITMLSLDNDMLNSDEQSPKLFSIGTLSSSLIILIL